MPESKTRRDFLYSAPLAAAAIVLPASAMARADKPVQPDKFKLVAESEFAKFTDSSKTHPGNFNFFENTTLPVTATFTYEEKKSAREFEWHEGRDHLFQIVDGTTVYELGGVPQNGHNTKPGEWLAPVSTGATTLTLHKGDWLIIPRGTPHKRTTDKNVTFFLISTTGPVAT